MLESHSNEFQELSKSESLRLLKENTIGHLGCRSGRQLLVIPTFYIADNEAIYSHSQKGKKIKLMERDPRVCFQTEKVADTFNWKSVIVWGKYEQLHGDEATRVMRKLLKKMLSGAAAKKVSEFQLEMAAQLERAIIYKISIDRITGRKESAGF